MRSVALLLVSFLAASTVVACSSSSTSDDMAPSTMDAAAEDAASLDATADAPGPTKSDAGATDAAIADSNAAPDAMGSAPDAMGSVTDATLDANGPDTGPPGDATIGTGATDAAVSETGSGSIDASLDAGRESGTDAAIDAGFTCSAAASAKGSVGCDFFATEPEAYVTDQCFAAYVVNAASAPAHITVEYPVGTALDPANFTVIPSGIGASVTYAQYDDDAGLLPGQAAFVFLAGDGPTGASGAACPIAHPAVASGSIEGTGTTEAFHIATDVPVSAYQTSAYGSGNGIAGSTLLLPTTAWDTNYVVVTAAPYNSGAAANPSLDVIAYEDDTQVTLLPIAAVAGGGTLPAGAAGTPYVWTLGRGEQAQFSQQTDLTGSILQSNHPVGVLGANACMQVPVGTSFCDHGEQMLPPVKALGNAYAAVMFRPRVTGDMAVWRLVGVVSGTQLTYSTTPAGAALSLNQGQADTFTTDQPFTVQSQDSAHPFLLFELMTGAEWSGLSDMSGYGDPEIMAQVSPAQYGTTAAFVTDPTFPETNLVVVRAPDSASVFHDVTLDCAGTLTGWQSVGTYEWTRIDLTRHDFVPQGNCTNGPHTMSSTGPFNVSVWGWGSPETTITTGEVSYGYQAAMGASPINSVVVTASP